MTTEAWTRKKWINKTGNKIFLPHPWQFGLTLEKRRSSKRGNKRSLRNEEEKKMKQKRMTFCGRGRPWLMREITVALNYHRALWGPEEFSRHSKLLDTKENCRSLALNVLLNANSLGWLFCAIHSANLSCLLKIQQRAVQIPWPQILDHKFQT